jgi:hypothetical protein
MNTKIQLFEVLREKFKDSLGEDTETLSELLHAVGDASQALLHSILFMPELLVINDSVVLAFSFQYDSAKSDFVNLLAEGKRSRQEIEASFNWVEVAYLFDGSQGPATDEEDELLAGMVRDAWDGWLRVSFPDRRFTVEVLPPEVTGSSVGVRFYENR